MHESKKIRLRHGYLGPLTKAQIARANGVSEITVERFWRGEKAAGVLPKVRLHYAEQTTLPESDDVLVLDDAIDAVRAVERDTDDDPPLRPSGDIVAALADHHRDLDSIEKHEAPAAWLRFDLKGMPTPTHTMLMAMCRAFDQGRA